MAGEGQVKLVTMLAHPANLSGGYACHVCVGFDVSFANSLLRNRAMNVFTQSIFYFRQEYS